MKILIVLLLSLPMFSCGGNAILDPDPPLREDLNKIARHSIPRMIERTIEAEQNILISVNHKSPEALELISFLIPVLHDRDRLDISLWFLDGNGYEEILSFLKGDEGAPAARDLLFKSNPGLTGYREYIEVLEGLREFYQRLENPEEMRIIGNGDSFLRIALFDGRPAGDERRQYILHSPLLSDSRKWELPFRGQLYFMMIHDWPLDNYAVLELEGTALEKGFLSQKDSSTAREAGSYLDGVILMAYPRHYAPLTPIDSFISEENISEALAFFPGQLIREKTKPAAYLLNSSLARRHRRLSRGLSGQYDLILDMEPFKEE